MLVRRQPVRPAVEAIAPRRLEQSRRFARSVVDLPAPFAPMSVTICPSSTSRRDPLQRVDRPVVDV
jgi:hypothetical protein